MNTKQEPRKKETGRLFFSSTGCVNLVTLALLHYDNVQVAPLPKSHRAVFLPGLFGVPTITAVAFAGVSIAEHAPFLASLTVEAPCANSTNALLA